MPIALCRVDDRLIHGQVVLGWGGPLHVDLIVLVDDAVQGSDWERDIYRMALPPEMEVEFASSTEAGTRLREWEAGPRQVIVLTGDLATMTQLVEAGEGLITRVNIGGLHHQPGRTKRLRYVYLSEEEVAQLRALEATGVIVTAQDLPGATPVPVTELLA